MGFSLDQVVPWGRSFEEYLRMFGLTKKELGLKIISCGDGPAGFNAEMNKRGYKVISCDPVYKFSASQIKSRIDKTYDLVMEQLRKNKQDYVWKTFDTPEEVGHARMKAMRDFLEDYERGKKEGRYITGSLPELAINDNKFDLALCSHFLFLYTRHLSLGFHIKSIIEMLRIAGEVRIFPLLELNGKKSSYVRDVLLKLREKGYKASVLKVNYEFQRLGNEMLKINRLAHGLY